MTLSDTKIHLLNCLELCVAIFRGPDSETWSDLASNGVPHLLDAVQGFSGPTVDPLRGLAAALEGAPGHEELESEYVRLFIAGPGGIPAPLYESCHLDDRPRTMGEPALAMRDRLDAAGLEVSLDSNEPPDHLTIELEYLFTLLAEGWSSRPETAAQGADFAGQVMLPWVRRFRDALAGADPHPVFGCAADLCVGTLEAISA